MKKHAFAALNLSIGISGVAGFETYTGQQVLQCRVEGAEFGAQFEKLCAVDGLDVWGTSKEGTLDIRVPTKLAADDTRAFFRAGCDVLIDDLESNLNQFNDEHELSQQRDGWFESYHRYGEIVDWYRELSNRYSENVEYTSSIGQSYENRDIPAIRISSDLTNRELPSFYIQCQIHAREWISVAACSYVVDKLLADYSRGDERAVFALRNSQIHVVPVVNPDGYEFTHTNQRLWRKNRNVNAGSLCIGTDLNRNYDDHHGEGGSSSNPCSDTYMGSGPESEPETKVTSDYFRAISPVIGAIDMHAYGQLILRPNGWTTAPSPDDAKMQEIGAGMQEAILATSGRRYSNTPSHELYVTTGSAQDWFYGEDATSTNRGYRAAGYTLELRPVGANPGFQLPPSEIIPTGEETYAALLSFFEDVIGEPILA